MAAITEDDGLSIRDIVETILTRNCDEPEVDRCTQAMFGAFQILRTVMQGEPATCDGCCGSILKWLELYGELTEANVRKWLDDIKSVTDIVIPNRTINYAISADDEDDE